MQKRTLMNLNQQMTGGDIQKEFSSDYLYSPSFGAVTKNYLK
jgi:hypothetical protein